MLKRYIRGKRNSMRAGPITWEGKLANDRSGLTRGAAVGSTRNRVHGLELEDEESIRDETQKVQV